jgi:carbamoyl-phosphate synthase large subunit
MEKTRILMTGAGAPGAAGIIRCLTTQDWIELFLCDYNEHAVGRYLHKGSFVKVPKAGDPGYKDFVLKYCVENGINLVMPLVTRELFVFAEYKEEFARAGVRVLVSQSSALNIANNKSDLYQFLKNAGDVIPDFLRVSDIDSFRSAISALGFPSSVVCFKPSVSNGSRGFRILDNNIDSYDLLFNHKPNNTYISLENALSILSSRPFPELLVSEFLPGEEYSVDCLANNGHLELAVPRFRKRMLEGISIEGEIVKNDDLIQKSEDIIRRIGLHGNIGIQFKKSVDGKFKLLEINPRVQGTIVAALGAGVNLPVLAVKQEMGMEITKSEMEVRWGTNFIRFWNEVYY